MPLPVVGLVWTAFSALVFSRIGAWAVALLASLGLGLAVQGALVGPALDYVQSSMTGLPGNIAAWLGMLNVDKYFTIVGSAYVGGGIKKVILRKLAA